MRIIDTAHHISFSDQNTAPQYACIHQCKKVWWDVDFDDKPKDSCPMCGGDLVEAIEKVHFNVLYAANRDVRYKDIKKIMQIPQKEKLQIKQYFDIGAKLNNLSFIKPAFNKKARNEWCKSGSVLDDM